MLYPFKNKQAISIKLNHPVSNIYLIFKLTGGQFENAKIKTTCCDERSTARKCKIKVSAFGGWLILHQFL